MPCCLLVFLPGFLPRRPNRVGAGEWAAAVFSRRPPLAAGDGRPILSPGGDRRRPLCHLPETAGRQLQAAAAARPAPSLPRPRPAAGPVPRISSKNCDVCATLARARQCLRRSVSTHAAEQQTRAAPSALAACPAQHSRAGRPVWSVSGCARASDCRGPRAASSLSGCVLVRARAAVG